MKRTSSIVLLLLRLFAYPTAAAWPIIVLVRVEDYGAHSLLD